MTVGRMLSESSIRSVTDYLARYATWLQGEAPKFLNVSTELAQIDERLAAELSGMGGSARALTPPVTFSIDCKLHRVQKWALTEARREITGTMSLLESAFTALPIEEGDKLRTSLSHVLAAAEAGVVKIKSLIRASGVSIALGLVIFVGGTYLFSQRSSFHSEV